MAVAQMAGARRERQRWRASEPGLGKFRRQAEMPQDPLNDARLWMPTIGPATLTASSAQAFEDYTLLV